MESYDGCSNNRCLCILQVIISIIIGVIVGILFLTGSIIGIASLPTIALVTSIVSIFIIITSLFTSNLLRECKNSFKKCICKVNSCLIIATIGTVVASTIALLTGILVTTLISIISIAITAFFFSWMLMGILTLLLCLVKSICKE